MSDALVLAGEYGNVLDGATYSSTPSANSLLPFSKLSDGDPGSVGRFGSLTAAPAVWADIDWLRGTGGGEIFTGAVPGSPTTRQWVEANTGTGDVTQEGTIKHSGNFSIRCSAGTGTSSAYVDVPVRAGQWWRLAGWLRSDGIGGTASVRIRNLDTGLFWDAALEEWVSLTVDAMSEPGAVFVEAVTRFQIEDFDACGGPIATLRIEVAERNATRVSYFDDFVLIPGVDIVAIIGHNITPRCGLTLIASDDNFSSIRTIATLTPRRGAFWQSIPAADPTGVYFYRYWKLAFTETNTGQGPIWMAEWVMGAALTLARGPSYPFRKTSRQPQIRVERALGAPAVIGHGTIEQRTIPLSFRCSRAQQSEFLQEVFVRSQSGAPALLVPAHNEPHVHYGHFSEEYPEEWPAKNYVDYSTTFEELAAPLVVG